MGRLYIPAVYISLSFYSSRHVTCVAGCVDVDTKRSRRESRRWERENSFANGARSRFEEGFGISIESNGCSIKSSNRCSPNVPLGACTVNIWTKHFLINQSWNVDDRLQVESIRALLFCVRDACPHSKIRVSISDCHCEHHAHLFG